ncbi:MAG TPA: hypothetical protein VGO34_07815 [Alphaproteobacteria bacterium]
MTTPLPNLSRLLGTTAVLAGAGLMLAACAGNTVNMPRATDVSLAPRVIDPGQATIVSYRIAGSASNVASVDLIGLPANSMTAGTMTKLAVPATPNTVSNTSVAVRAPAKDGVYPVSLRVTTTNGAVSDTPVGTLTVNNVPSRIENAQISPSSHNVMACAGQPVNVQLSYTVTDGNGASDMRDPRVVQVRGASTAAVTTPYVLQSASVVPVAPGTVITTTTPASTVVAQPNGTYTIVNPTVQTQQVLVAPTAATAIALPPGGVMLGAPTRGDSVQETVTTPLTIACPMAAPAQWEWVVQGTDDDAPHGQVVSTNQAVAKYFTNQ